MLLDNHGNYINDEWQTVDNLNKTIQDEHWKLTNFSFIRIKKKKQKIPEWLKEALLEEVKNITEDLKLLEETM